MASEAGSGTPETGMCAARGCTNMCSMKCARCKTLFYCSKSCQTGHWKTHKDDCRGWAELGFEVDLQDQETRMKAHAREFRRIVCQYGLDKEARADAFADFLTATDLHTSVSPEKLAEQFNIPRGDASTLLSWVDVGLRFKEEALDAAKNA